MIPIVAITRTEIGAVPSESHEFLEGEQIERRTNVDIVPASGPKKDDWCVSAKRSSSSKLSCTVRRGPRKLPYPVSAMPDHMLSLIAFHSITFVTLLSYPARGNTAWLCARTGTREGPVWQQGRSRVHLSAQAVVSRGDKISTVPRGFCRKSIAVPREYRQDVWRD